MLKCEKVKTRKALKYKEKSRSTKYCGTVKKWCRWWDSNPHAVASGGF